MSLLELKSAALDCEFILCFILPNFCPNLHLFSPNKLAYPDFKARYNIIGAAAVAKAKNDKAAGQAVMDIVKLDKDKYRLGQHRWLDGGAARKQDRKCSRLASRLLACQDLEVAPDLNVRLQNMNT